MKSFIFLTVAILALTKGSDAQPYDSLLFVGQNAYEPSTIDTLYSNACMATIPYKFLVDSTYTRSDWRFLPESQIDDLFPWVSPNELIPRAVGRGGVAYSTPGSRHWFVSSGLHTWDSLNRRVTTYPLAWRAAEQQGFGFDGIGHYGYQNHLMLPRRDSLGKFFHLVFDLSWQAPVNFTYARQSFDQLLLYRVDAIEDRSIAETTTGRSGNGRHMRYRPAPDDTLARYDAIAWTGGANTYDTIKANRQPLSTLSHMVGIPHGNGRDWWVFATGGQQSNRSVAVFLLNKDGLRLEHYYPEGIPFYRAYQHFFFLGSQLTVSPDGNMIAMHSTPNPNLVAPYPDIVSGEPFAWDDTGLVLWNFDRCSGEITQTRKIAIDYEPTGLFDRYFDDDPPETTREGNGVAFGPNNKYLFYAERSYVARLDLTSNNIPGSQELLPIQVGNYAACKGGPFSNGYLGFSYITVLPNGTLLGSPGGSCRIQYAYFNVASENISDVFGGLATLQTPCISSVKHIRQSIGSYDLDGSSCDTLGIDGWQPDCTPFRPVADTSYICSGGIYPDTLQWRGKAISKGGEYIYKIQDPRGCDSLWKLVVIEDENVGPVNVTVHASPGDTIGATVVQSDTIFTEVYLRAQSACDSVVNYTVTVRSSSTREASLVGTLQVYPNPTSSSSTKVTIILPERRQRGGDLEMIDVLGRSWYKGSNLPGQREIIDVAAFPSGIYLVQYTEGRAVWQAQVVVE
jgi:hypothetical protein